MCKPNSQVDALRHVRFAGRPAIAISRFSKRINPNSTTGKYDKVCMVEQHNEFISWVLEHACLTADSYRSEPLNRRIAACLRALHVTTEAHARLKLEQHPELLPTAIGALLIGVTEFLETHRYLKYCGQRYYRNWLLPLGHYGYGAPGVLMGRSFTAWLFYLIK